MDSGGGEREDKEQLRRGVSVGGIFGSIAMYAPVYVGSKIRCYQQAERQIMYLVLDLGIAADREQDKILTCANRCEVPLCLLLRSVLPSTHLLTSGGTTEHFARLKI